MSNAEASYTAQLSREIDAAYTGYKAREPGSEEKLYNALHTQARHVLRCRFGEYDRTLEEEITHRALMALPKFRGDSALSTWFYRLALNEANRELRRLIVTRGRFVPIDEAERPDKEVGPDALRDRAQLRSALPPEQAKVLRLKDEGYTLQQIAEKTGTAIGTVRSRYERAKKKVGTGGI